MALSPPSHLLQLDPLQCSYGGFEIGRRGVELVSTNLYDLPVVSLHDVRRGQGHGQFRGTDRLGGATWTLTLEVWPDSDVSLDDVLDAFEVDKEDWFIFRPGDGGPVRWRRARISNRAGPTLNVSNITSQAYQVVVELHSTNPRWSFDAGDAVLSPYSVMSVGGLTFPFDLPFSFTMAGESNIQGVGEVYLHNQGNLPSLPFVCIHGPATNPSIETIFEDVSTRMSFEGQVADGQTLEVDFAERTIQIDGANRYFWLQDPSTWWDLPPGISEIRLHASNTEARAAISWTSSRV